MFSVWNQVKPIISSLEASEQQVLLSVYGLDGNSPSKIKDISKKTALSAEEISTHLHKGREIIHSKYKKSWLSVSNFLYDQFKEYTGTIGSQNLGKVLPARSTEDLIQEVKATALILDIDQERFTQITNKQTKLRTGWKISNKNLNNNRLTFSKKVKSNKVSSIKESFILQTPPGSTLKTLQTLREGGFKDKESLAKKLNISYKYLLNTLNDLCKLNLIVRKKGQYFLQKNDDPQNSVSNQLQATFKNHPSVDTLLSNINNGITFTIEKFANELKQDTRIPNVSKNSWLIYAKTLTAWLKELRLAVPINNKIHSIKTHAKFLKIPSYHRISNYPFPQNSYRELIRFLQFMGKPGRISKKSAVAQYNKSPKTIEKHLVDCKRLDFVSVRKDGKFSITNLGRSFIIAPLEFKKDIFRKQIKKYPIINEFLKKLKNNNVIDYQKTVKYILAKKGIKRKSGTINSITQDIKSWCIAVDLIKEKGIKAKQQIVPKNLDKEITINFPKEQIRNEVIKKGQLKKTSSDRSKKLFILPSGCLEIARMQKNKISHLISYQYSKDNISIREYSVIHKLTKKGINFNKRDFEKFAHLIDKVNKPKKLKNQEVILGEMDLSIESRKIVVKFNEVYGNKGFDIRECVTKNNTPAWLKSGVWINQSKWKEFKQLVNKTQSHLSLSTDNYLENLDLPQEVLNVLNKKKFKTVNDIVDKTDEELFKIKTLGPKRIRLIRKALEEYTNKQLFKRDIQNLSYIPVQQKQLVLSAKKLIGSITNLRSKNIVIRHYGLFGKHKETLESIGKNYKISRERVRQILAKTIKELQHPSKRYLLLSLENSLMKEFEELGGLIPVIKDSRYGTIFIGLKKNYEAGLLEFILDLSYSFKLIKINDDTMVWITDSLDENFFKYILGKTEEILDHLKVDISLDQIYELLLQDQRLSVNFPEQNINKKFIATCLKTNPKINRLGNGNYALRSWSVYFPKNWGDFIYKIFIESKSPLHFREVAQRCNEIGFKGKKIMVRRAHNILIDDDRFVRVGAGTYALKEWGYKPGFTKDIIKEYLAEKGKPVKLSQIAKFVRRHKKVNYTTVASVLKKPEFARFGKGMYGLKEWKRFSILKLFDK